MISVPSSARYKISDNQPLTAIATQCTLVGFNEFDHKIGGIAHIHFSQNPEIILGHYFDELSKIANYESSMINVGGGATNFVPGLGLISGAPNIDKTLNYLIKNGLDKYISDSRVKQDKKTKIQVYPQTFVMNLLQYNM